MFSFLFSNEGMCTFGVCTFGVGSKVVNSICQTEKGNDGLPQCVSNAERVDIQGSVKSSYTIKYKQGRLPKSIGASLNSTTEAALMSSFKCSDVQIICLLGFT